MLRALETAGARLPRAGFAAPRDLRTAGLVSTSRRERARRQVVRLLLLLYLLVIFEGALRKWVAPQFSQYLFFLRDPFLLWAYALATLHGLWPRRETLLAVTLGLCGIGLLLLVLQAVAGGFSDLRLILAVHGFRSYFLYVPLAFLVGAVLQREDLARLYRWTLLLALPIAVLVSLQFFSPPGAPINVGISADEAFQFRGLTATAERTRPMGPFASGAGQQQFVATAWAIALGLFISSAAQRRVALPLLAIGTAAVLVCVGLSGSRGTVLQCGLAAAFALAVGVIGRGGAQKSRALLWTLGLSALALMLYPILLPEGFEAFTTRWDAAAAVEQRQFEGAVVGRALLGFVDFVRLIDQVPLFGYGLGFGSNASITLQASIDGVMPGKLAETDFSRHMVDLGPVFGIGYIAFRFAVAGALAAMALRVTRLVADPMPMLLLSYVGIVLLNGQITGQGAINFYGWFFAGVLIAACRQAGRGRRRPRTARLPARVPR